MKTLMITALFSALSISSASAITLSGRALSLVPNGKIQSQKNNEFKILTPNNTVVEVELKKKGEIDEASGDNLLKDSFTPDEGLVGLETIVTELNANAAGGVFTKWSLEKNLRHGWHYEVAVLKDNKEFEYILDAKTGKVLSSKID